MILVDESHVGFTKVEMVPVEHGPLRLNGEDQQPGTHADVCAVLQVERGIGKLSIKQQKITEESQRG